jgi:hypothetical protein
VGISGDMIVVGANDEDSSATGVDGDQTDNSAPTAGAAYVFKVSGQLLNIATRLKVLTGENVLIGGFIITGTDQKKVSSAASVRRSRPFSAEYWRTRLWNYSRATPCST